MTWIDLTHTLTPGTQYPGDPPIVIEPALTLEADGVAVSRLQLSTHSGTHVDAPCHTVAGGRTVDQIGLGELLGPARVIAVDAAASGRIEVGDLGELPERLPPIVLIATGWDRWFGTRGYREHPALTVESAELLWSRGMRVLGVDAFSPDPIDSPDFPVHALVLGRDGLIVENLRGLTALPAECEVGIHPLAVGPLDGAPVRAVARPF
ncbi:Cyclase family protein OS=Tsukamurella paurometabola (strain ATCC 8368 / DSM / CCUG 35730 /CIP 100753 / JCM 10117 / KCTC 9821 / NBRC 16120 / NCIMB 702349/ NCTC 13040) OX=521096 GN=Tpau_4071 PE=4 SV=1 [Tsukamurella paurometabola]|uniref:Cyclase family protein n=1 Tax=Tsukamurella paurometabola (strain ATCC 8368 / DSM 20162 / CCUG 35730 / CIP 100753 / JCM 10117 / KCTC 9821 / NBRC 16120 / NCIMB 702349 / NCTC 13040) TaxID=521096 RepID=D5UNE6_TSUPD|nr:cyclase family protein [Tsukamurella paurometabola]ADG80641.1 cyclase family protein [Tsukamurella paurometabola DSM 20162]SUP40394.1 Kynurenine formamidase [Tsukamurella paurometabola]